MADTDQSHGAPVAVISDDDRRRFVDDHRIPVSPLRIASGGIAGCGSLVMGVGAIGFFIASIVSFNGITIMLAAWVLVAILTVFAVGLGQLAWQWTHSRSPIGPTRTPAEERRAIEAFNAERVPQTFMQPHKTVVPTTTTASLTKKSTR